MGDRESNIPLCIGPLASQPKLKGLKSGRHESRGVLRPMPCERVCMFSAHDRSLDYGEMCQCRIVGSGSTWHDKNLVQGRLQLAREVGCP